MIGHREQCYCKSSLMVMHLTTGGACQLRGVYPRFKMYHYWEVLDLQQVKYIFMCRRGKERNKSTYQWANALKTCEKPKQLWITDAKIHSMPKSHTDFVSFAYSGPSRFWELISFHLNGDGTRTQKDGYSLNGLSWSLADSA